MYECKVYQMDGEIWKSIPGYEGVYEASSLGRIRTVNNKVTHSVLHGIRRWKGRILKPKSQRNQLKTGYKVTLWKDKKPYDWLVARLVASAFLGISNLTVNHKDGNRLNNNIENLEWLSLADNIRHAFNSGLMHCNQPVTLIQAGKMYKFISMARASKFLGKNKNYISGQLKRKKPVCDKTGIVMQIVVGR